MTNFKPGDKVRVIDDTNHAAEVRPPFRKGDVVTIDFVSTQGTYVGIREHTLHSTAWRAGRFELVRDREFCRFEDRDRVVVVNPTGTPWRHGQEVSVATTSGSYVKIVGHDAWMAVERFRKVVPEPLIKFDFRADTMTIPSRVVLVANDVAVESIPRRSYDHAKGDRRFTRADAAVEHAEAEFDHTGVLHVVRRDPGSYDFQELFLVQALGS